MAHINKPKRKNIIHPKSISAKKRQKIIQAAESAEELIGEELNENQKEFCKQYIWDWNATRAYMAVYKGIKDNTVAKAAACRLLTNVYIKAYIAELQKDLEKLVGVSKQMVMDEYRKMAFSNIAHLHNTWITLKEFNKLTADEKACIQEIDTKVVSTTIPGTKVKQKIDYVRIKLYDKAKALEGLSKLVGYNAAEKKELSGPNGTPLMPQYDLSKYTDEELRILAELQRKSRAGETPSA